MKKIYLPDDELTQTILGLLALSSLSEKAKQAWLEVLPDMRIEDKEELRKNLSEQVALDAEIASDAVQDLLKVLRPTL